MSSQELHVPPDDAAKAATLREEVRLLLQLLSLGV